MQTLILNPVSHPDMGQIVIDDALFAIGRREEPFASDTSGSAAKLSRRHARIFMENGVAYLTDLGSLNGTQLNGAPLGREAVVLNAGDEVGLGGEFTFTVEVQEAGDETTDRTVAAGASTRLVLRPVNAESGLETIVVDRFPFLVNRNDELFAQYLDRYADDVRRISRRQAVILEKGQDVCVEDLDSANGTFIDGQRLDEHARPLREGDVIAFGSQRFSYRVAIERYDTTAGQDATVFASVDTTGARDGTGRSGAEAAAPVDDTGGAVSVAADHTRFVDSATSFLDVFCAEEERDDAEDEAEQVAAVGARKGGFRRTAEALELPGLRRRSVALASVAVAVMAGALILVYLSGADRRAIKDLLDGGDFAASAAAAQSYLSEAGGDTEAERWGEEALIRAVLPGWMTALEEYRFEDARAHIADATAAHPAIEGAQETLTLLNWATRMQEYLYERGGADSPMSILGDEKTIERLLGEWEADRFRHRQLLTQAGIFDPKFENMAADLVSHLRSLRRDHATYGSDIRALKRDLSGWLRSGELDKVDAALRTFAAEHPRLGGIDAVQSDVDRYRRLRELSEKDPIEFAEAADATEFRTELVAEPAGRWLADAAPPGDMVAAYREARGAWRTGSLQEAVAALAPLTDGAAGAVVQREIDRLRSIYAQFEALEAHRGTPDFQSRLADFRTSLNRPEDVFFLQATEDDFQRFRADLLADLENRLSNARQSWTDFKNDGGLPSVVRVEERVSERFVRQSGLLSQAYAELKEGEGAYRTLGRQPPPDWRQLVVSVENEIKRQRRALEALSIVLEPALLEAKLARLPKVEE